jgi:hypothetical protein
VKVVFFGRFVAILRTFAAFFAGVSNMRWSRFLLANAAGGLLWSALYAFGAYALGRAAQNVGSTITIVGYVVASVLTVVTIVVTRISLRRLEQRAEAAFPDEQLTVTRALAATHTFKQADHPERSRGSAPSLTERPPWPIPSLDTQA